MKVKRNSQVDDEFSFAESVPKQGSVSQETVNHKSSAPDTDSVESSGRDYSNITSKARVSNGVEVDRRGKQGSSVNDQRTSSSREQVPTPSGKPNISKPKVDKPRQEKVQKTKKVNTQVNQQLVVNVGKPKKRTKLPLILLLIGIIAVVVICVFTLGNKKPEQVPVVLDYNTSGRFAYDTLQNALNNYDAVSIDSAVGIEDGDSYLAQEWAYVNGVKLRQEFITKVCALVDFSYPLIYQTNIDGSVYIDESGNSVQIESYMNSGEPVTVTIPDYYKLELTMEEDVEYIKQMFKSSGYSDADYAWYDEMANLLLQYICDKPSIPTKTVELTLPVGLSVENIPYIKDDSELDKVLFSSDEFHSMISRFAQLALGWTGEKPEEYTVKEEVENPEYKEWLVLFNQYYAEDDGKFNKNKSKWEPWFLRDENNEFVYDENGEKVVNYYSVKAEDGTDWIEPDKTIFVDVPKTRMVADPWVEETGILYNFIGTWYIQNEYDGLGSRIFRVGDGSIERPAGIGTSIITKALGTDDKYHDVRVTLLGYWTGQDAIDYAEKFSSKNRGFTIQSVVQLITYEILVENLELEPITISSEMTLCDDNSNISSRTGTMYEFTEEFTLGVGESKIINDWATSTELQQKYVCWGKSFGRSYSMIYFDALAGTGVIPSYSAYEAFTGKSVMNN